MDPATPMASQPPGVSVVTTRSSYTSHALLVKFPPSLIRIHRAVVSQELAPLSLNDTRSAVLASLSGQRMKCLILRAT